jgi:hypothetical protein
MNKDYKLMAGLIPIILVLSIVLSLFPDASGLKTEITTPILSQTNNSSLNQSSDNTTYKTEVDSVGTQYTQDNTYNDYTPPDNTDTSSEDNNTEPTNPDDTIDQTNTTI